MEAGLLYAVLELFSYIMGVVNPEQSFCFPVSMSKQHSLCPLVCPALSRCVPRDSQLCAAPCRQGVIVGVQAEFLQQVIGEGVERPDRVAAAT